GCGFALQLIMTTIPPELIVMVGVLILLTLLCTWAIRADFRLPDGRTDWWELIEASVSILLMLAMQLGLAGACALSLLGHCRHPVDGRVREAGHDLGRVLGCRGVATR